MRARGYPTISTLCSSSSSTHGTGTWDERSGPTRSRSSGSYPCAMAAANRTRSRVWGSRLSCFDIIILSLGIGARSYSRGQARKKRTAEGEIQGEPLFRLPFAAMHAPISPLLVAIALASVFAPTRVAAQASPYIPLDDPRLPLLEHLIARGEIEDPSPMVRPFRRADAVRVLAAADSSADPAHSKVIRSLREELQDGPGEARWSLEGRAGAQAYSHARREHAP